MGADKICWASSNQVHTFFAIYYFTNLLFLYYHELESFIIFITFRAATRSMRSVTIRAYVQVNDKIVPVGIKHWFV
jgi:hypothetical protein